jgi:hypothetical protein
MTPTLIVLGLLALGVGIVALATRQPRSTPRGPVQDQRAAPGETPPVAAAVVDPFAHAPLPRSVGEPVTEEERQP